MTALLVMMVVALFQVSRDELSTTRHHHDRVAALYLAEAGLMDAMQELQQDPAWEAGFLQRTIPGVEGYYECQFNTTGTGPFLPSESVNNSDGSKPDNHAGNEMVPDGCVALVITAHVRSATRTVEALVETGKVSYPARYPLLTDGRIELRGNVLIDGKHSLDTNERVQGDVHSNLNSGDSDLVTWDGSGTIQITGEVTSSGPSSSAIDLAGYTPEGGPPETDVAQKSYPDVKILDRIAAASGEPAPTINSGTTVISGAPRQHFDGDLEIQGDLVLDGTELYVSGALKVNGTIRGEGSVYVGGDTEFKGDTQITTVSPNNVALFSHGNVQLEGFDGTSFMNSLAGHPEIAESWQQIDDDIQIILDEVNAPDASQRLGYESRMDQAKQGVGGLEINFPGGGGAGSTIHGNRIAAKGTVLKQQLAALPPSSAKDFMQDRFRQIEEALFNVSNNSDAVILGRVLVGDFEPGAVDAINDRWGTLTAQQKEELLPRLREYLNRLNPKHIGASYFSGLVFTHGAVLATNEVTVIGAIVAKGEDSDVEPLEFEGEELHPGDIVLTNNSQATYVEEFFYGGSGQGGKGILLWMAR